MRRFVLPPSFGGEGPLALDGKDARYLSRVLRLRPGDSFPGVDAGGRLWTLTLRGQEGARLLLDARAAAANADSRGALPGTPADSSARGADISLYLCLTKGAKLDQAVRQATEAGVRRIIPLESENAVRREAGDSGGARAERLARIVREARQQSGSLCPTEVLPTMPLAAAAVGAPAAGPAFFFHEAPLAETSLHRYLDPVPAAVALLVGPEGGLSPAETGLLTGAGWIPIHLGPTVLRAETAAIYALAAVQTILWEHGSWSPKTDSPPNA